MSRARTIADFGNGIATADIDDGAVTAGKLNSTLDLSGKTVTLPAGVGGDSGLIVNSRSYNSGYGTGARTTQSTQVWSTIKTDGTNKDVYAPADNGNIRAYVKQRNDTHLRIRGYFPVYITPGGTGCGLRVQMVLSDSSSTYNDAANYFTVGLLSQSMGHGWGMAGYGGADVDVISFYYDTAHGGGSGQSNTDTANILAYTGTLHFYFQGYVWASSDTVYWIDQSDLYPKNASWVVEEYIA